MQARDAEAYAAFWRNPTRNAPPGGESFAAQMRRTAAAIERLTAAFAGRDIVSVSHGGTIRAAVAHALDLTPEAAMAIIIDNLSLTRLSLVHDRLSLFWDLERYRKGGFRETGDTVAYRSTVIEVPGKRDVVCETNSA